MEFNKWLKIRETGSDYSHPKEGNWAKLQQLLGHGGRGGPLLAWDAKNYTTQWHNMLVQALWEVEKEDLAGWIEPFKPTEESDKLMKQAPKEKNFESYRDFMDARDEWGKRFSKFNQRAYNYRCYLQEIYDKLTGYHPFRMSADNPFDHERDPWPGTGDPS